MPKKNCCCVVGTYIAIPCRYYSAHKFTGGTPQWAHWDGSPEGSGGFGGGQSNLKGPFRNVNGQVVFDTTRKIFLWLKVKLKTPKESLLKTKIIFLLHM